MPWLHTPTVGGRDQLYLRFPAFFAGMALAVERSRKGHPSHQNLIIGAVASAGIWGALLFAPNVGGPAYAAVRAALRLPLATVATYFAMRPFVAYPPEEVFKSDWQQKVHKVGGNRGIHCSVESITSNRELAYANAFHPPPL